MSQIISLSKTLKPTTQTQKPSHGIQNRQNNMKHIALNTYIVCIHIHTNRTQLNKLKPIAHFPPKKKKKIKLILLNSITEFQTQRLI